MYNLIAAVSKNGGIGLNDNMPWHIPDDLKYFYELTKNNIVIMGRTTYNKIGVLKNRTNIVISSRVKYGPSVSFVCLDDIECYIRDINNNQKVFIIGGEMTYSHFLDRGLISKAHITLIEKEYECDRFMPSFNGKLISYSTLQGSNVKYRHLEYDVKYNQPSELKYHNLILRTLKGVMRDDRTQTGTISTFGDRIRFKLDTFPLLTSKYVSWPIIVKELLMFLKGETNTKGLKIWEKNTSSETLKALGLPYAAGDMGPMYGWQWRHYGEKYESGKNYKDKGYDQLNKLINDIKNTPFSRRLLLTTYNPIDAEISCLYPCHGLTVQFYVDNGALSCHMYQRSCDLFLGLPFNIASYALLTYIIAEKTNLRPKEILISFGDLHIYNNLVEQCHTQLQQNIYPFPTVELIDVVNTNWEDLTMANFNIINYIHSPRIIGEMSV